MAEQERVPDDGDRQASLGEILPLIDAIEQRLTVIEERLGISLKPDGG